MKLIFTLFLFVFCLIFSAAVFAQVEETETDDLIRIETNLVSVPVVVSDRDGRFISGLKEGDFTIYQDGIRQEIAFFADEKEPINVAVLLDTSVSTAEVLDKIKEAAFSFIKLLNKKDRAMIISFDRDVKILSHLTSDHNELRNSINRAEAQNGIGTVLRKSVNDVVNPLFAEVKGRKAIIVLTDGKDFGSYISEDELLYNLEESDVLVYTVFYLTELTKFLLTDPAVINSSINRNIPQAGVQRSEKNQRRIDLIKKSNLEATAFLNKMSDITAGRFYEKDVTDLSQTFKLIVDELRKQYRLGFYPPEDVEKGVSHSIKVTVVRREAVVRARKSYRPR